MQYGSARSRKQTRISYQVTVSGDALSRRWPPMTALALVNDPNPTVAAQSDPTVTRLVEDNLALVGHLVREMLAKVPAHVSRDELSSAAMMALVVSAQGFDPERGVPFARFAAIRIRGALMDELRSMDWAARSVRSRAREVESARSTLAATLGRTPRPDEVATTMGVSVAELDSIN